MKKQRVSNYVRTYRNRSGLSQEEVAYLLGIKSGDDVIKHEKGISRPKLGVAIAYEIAFQTRFLDLYPNLYGETDFAVRKRAAKLLEKLDSRKYVGRTRQKVEFLSAILQAPDVISSNRSSR